jgi:hypothetical protein
MEKRKQNWSLWAGFLVALIAFVSYFLFFSQFPITRDFPWVNFLLFGLAAVLLAAGLRRVWPPLLLSRENLGADSCHPQCGCSWSLLLHRIYCVKAFALGCRCP